MHILANAFSWVDALRLSSTQRSAGLSEVVLTWEPLEDEFSKKKMYGKINEETGFRIIDGREGEQVRVCFAH